MRLVPERAPTVPRATWEWDNALGHWIVHLDGCRIPLQAADLPQLHVPRLIARECLRLLVHRLGIPLRFLAPRLARGRAGLPGWMLGDPAWLQIVSLAEQGAREMTEFAG